MADCNGCSYTACLHFGEQGGCFYGGPMVDEVYPAVRKCDALVMLCANYNDALAANLTACVNRLTALFRQTRMYDKRIFGLIVSGYSGRRPAGPPADLRPEYEQVLLPSAPLLPAGNGQ